MSTSDTHALLLLLVTSNGMALSRSIDYYPARWIFAHASPVHALRAYFLRCSLCGRQSPSGSVRNPTARTHVQKKDATARPSPPTRSLIADGRPRLCTRDSGALSSGRSAGRADGRGATPAGRSPT